MVDVSRETSTRRDRPQWMVGGSMGDGMSIKELARVEARVRLIELYGVQPGDTLRTILRHKVRSGMSRSISVVKVAGEDVLSLDGNVAQLIGWQFDQTHGGVKVSGCGMDMGFHLVYTLSRELFPVYDCLGEDARCPSNVHANYPREPYGGTHTDGYALRQRWL